MTSDALPAQGTDDASPEHTGIAQRWASIISGVLLMVGIMTMLRSGYREWDVQHARTVFFWPGHFLTGVAETTIGLVGIACATREHTARAFLAVSGCFLAAWAVAAIILDSNPNDVFANDPMLVGLHLGAALIGLAAAAVSARAAH